MSEAPIVAVIGELVPIIMIATVGAVVVASRYFRHKERQQMQDTLRTAYERGQPVQPELIAMLQAPPRETRRSYGPERDLRRGLFWMAWALALLAAGGALYYYDPSNDSTGGFMAFAAFPGFIGAAYLVIYFLTRGKSKS